jgi:GAF domain-containing protein
MPPIMSPHSELPRGVAEQLRIALDAGEMGTWEWHIAEERVVWSESLERTHGLDAAVTRLAPPAQADYCVFDLVEDGVTRRVAAHADREAQGGADALQQYAPTGLVATVIRLGEPLLIRDWNVVADADQPVSAAHASLGQGINPRSLIIVPLRGSTGDTLGALSFVLSLQDCCYDSADLELACALAARAAVAIGNARLYRTVSESGHLLQQQAHDLELRAQQLEDQAAEMETQQPEMKQPAAELQAINEERRQTNLELDAARANAVGAHAYVTGILGAIADPFVVYDADWRFQYMNNAAVDVFNGVDAGSRQAMPGQILWEVFPDIVGTRFEGEMRRASESGVPVTFEELHPTRGAWSEVRCYPLPAGGIAVIWKDTTEKKRAEERLHFLSRAGAILSSSLDYRTTVSQVAQLLVPTLGDWCGVQLLDEHGKLQQFAVAHADPEKAKWAWELDKRYPVDMKAVVGVPNVLRTGKAESGRRYTPADQAFVEQLAERAALAIDNARLYTATVETRAATKLSRAQLEQVVAAMRRTNDDLTERTHLAEEARHAAEQANRAKSDFLAHISHELRKPLNAIAGYTDLMQLGIHGERTANQRDDLERIKRAQCLLLGHINDVLNSAKVDAGHIHYDIRPFALRSVVKELRPSRGTPDDGAVAAVRWRGDPRDDHGLCRRGEGAADPGGPARERHQVHVARRTHQHCGCHHRQHGPDRRHRYRHGYPGGQAGDDLRSVRAVGAHAVELPSGHWIGPGHQPRPRARHGRPVQR